jgi:ribose 5-phosphate isomerase A
VPTLRRAAGGDPFCTDQGNVILDCRFDAIDDAPALAATVKAIPGVVEHGLFLGMAAQAVVAGPGGVRVIDADTMAR